MFADWDNFYLLVGSASAGLIGLLFVVVTLTTGGDANRLARGNAIYLTPTALDFGIVLFVSAIAFTPRLPSLLAAALILVGGLVGLVFAALSTVRLARGEAPTP